MANFKHKVFLLIAKWIPVAVAAGIWFSNANDSEIEEKIIEATIANWFEDEDASSDKVWEYFRVI